MEVAPNGVRMCSPQAARSRFRAAATWNTSLWQAAAAAAHITLPEAVLVGCYPALCL
jgi:hypothetical protein